MIDPAQIPPEVVEAAARAYFTYIGLRWEDFDKTEQDAILEQLRAAIAAALSAWPGIHEWAFDDNQGTYPALILPLTEARDE